MEAAVADHVWSHVEIACARQAINYRIQSATRAI